MNIIYKKLDELIPYENNPRINDNAVDSVAASIREFGFKNPIIIDSNNVIVCGHTRFKASQKLNIKEVPCIIADDLTEEQIKAFRIADNKTSELAEWDYDLLEKELEGITHIDMGEFDIQMNEFQDIDPVFEDGIPEEEYIEVKAQKGDIYQLGEHRLMCGSSTDAADIEKLMDGKQADMCLTDPPYNINYEEIVELRAKAGCISKTRPTSNIENDYMDNESFYQFLKTFYSNLYNVLKNGGSYYIFHADLNRIEFSGALRDVGMKEREIIVWVKNRFSFGFQDYQWQHEPCLYGWKEGAAHYFVDDRTQGTVIEDKLDYKSMTKDQLIDIIKELLEPKEQTTIIREKRPVRSDLHPTMKPINLCARLIRNSSKKGEIVFDGFGGSGSTLIACEQVGRKCYTMELDPHYCDVIIARWEALTGLSAVKIN